MAEPVLYIRGIQSFPTEQLPEELLNDFKAIINLSDDDIGKLSMLLSEAKGFSSPKALLSTIQKVVNDPNASKAIRGIVGNFSPSQIKPTLTLLESKSKEKDFCFDQKQVKRLNQILEKLIQTYPSLARFQKAERLARITGQQLETVELICDIRPVFDENRNNVEGMMPYTRLHIVATGEDGLPNAFEVELTRQQVIDLAEKTGKAKSKLETLHKSIENWLPDGLPDLPLTRVLKKESSDA